MFTILIFMSSGLFLGWSLGANNAANIFGTAVATRMIRFKTAALITSIFVILGAVISGVGASETLGELGTMNELAGAFIVALSAALSVFWMTKWGLPVSTSQAIVGAIIGWNFFSGSPTDAKVLSKIMGTWIICPVLSAIFAAIFYYIIRALLKDTKIHLLTIDKYTRWGLIIVGAFGAYSLGANNIANVMGVFVAASPFNDFSINNINFSSTQILFFIGGLSIAVGVFTYSKRVMMTVGKQIFKISPISALITVLSSSTVLFLFASKTLKLWLTSRGLPSFPLVPVSASQAVVGAVIGIGLIKGVRNINYKKLLKIVIGWVLTPIIALLISYIALSFMQNVFMQAVI